MTSVVTEVAPEVQVRGSFYYGDFHYSIQHGLSLSDLDLVWPSSTVIEARALAFDVKDALLARTGLSIRTSIHPERNFESLSIVDARFLAVGEYLRWAPRFVDNHLALMHLQAKVALLLSRRSVQQRYAGVADLLGTPTARRALSVKLGCSESGFTTEDLVSMSGLLRRERSHRTLRTCLRHPQDAAARDTYMQELLARTTVSEWLRQYIASQLA